MEQLSKRSSSHTLNERKEPQEVMVDGIKSLENSTNVKGLEKYVRVL